MPTRTVKTSEVDVLIIGAGPAGLMACNALSKAGVNVRIVDKRPDKVMAGQADGIQPRTMEVLQSYGLVDQLLAQANQMHIAAFYNPNPVTGAIELTDRTPDVSETSTPYPFEATLHQGAIEEIFIDSIRKSGVEVSRPIAPGSIQISEIDKDSTNPDVFPVRVRFKPDFQKLWLTRSSQKVVLNHLDTLDDDGQPDTEVVHTKYVIGADGAHSWVRKSFDIEMEGEQTDFVWGVVDMVPQTDFPDIRNKSAIHSNHGSCMIIPREDDKVRLYIQLGSNEAIDATGRVDKEQMGPEKLLDVARKSMAPYTIKEPKNVDWWTIYRIGQRVAARFSVDERVFIAGDACHTHSPKAGQGMNASMNDAHNLAWKLVQVLRGWASPLLLKTYELERRKYARDLINFDKEFAKMFSGKIKATEGEEGFSHQEFMKAFQTFGGFTSGIGICYQDSVITNACHQSHARNLIIGKRLPSQTILRAADGRPIELQHLVPSDTRFKVLVFAGDIYDSAQKARVDRLGEDLAAADGFLRRYSPEGKISTAFDVLTIASKRDIVRVADLPDLLHSHWTKVFVDHKEFNGPRGGNAYANFGIDSHAGAVVIIRPDGYVGTIAPFEHVADLNGYFAEFTKQS
ncbi:hypothetical protein DXG03_007514 [Asterophora parasitica]|uniref:Phenol 2-monooxygenase n=1 Tax=Asterophora parasitica TaxID=117018 RepID=A0A9P7G7D4_9AGAR|nr:hypothetical protein DXG03_007514 [Asterophora parasitica]